MTTHNLNIQTYSFEELLGLFNLTTQFGIEELKKAKRKVLWMHPDKSHLPSEYFLFYKKAFEIIVVFFDEKIKQQKEVPKTEIVYTPMNTSENKKVGEVIKGIKVDDFNNMFNELFDKNMSKPIDDTRNEWFKKEDAMFSIPKTVNQKNMGSALTDIREKTSEMIKYNGVENMYSGGVNSANFHDDNMEEGYVSSDLFSKLKYDDLRRVHKDQTVFSVSESDYNNMTKYDSVDHLSRERGLQNLTPLEKTQAELLMEQQEKKYKEIMMKKQYESQLRTMEYNEKNKTVLANFMRLK
jgi:hypothetical protein